VLQFVCDVVKDTGKEGYLRPFIHIGFIWMKLLEEHHTNAPEDAIMAIAVMGLLHLRYEHDSTTIRVRYNILRGVMCFRAIMNI